MSGTADLVDSLNILIPKLMRQNEVVGLSIVLIRDGKISWSEGFDYMNLELKARVLKDISFEIASLTKPTIAFLALKLLEEKKLDLDTPLLNYLSKIQLDNQPLEKQLKAFL